MVSICKRLINIVNQNKPKMLKGLTQKGKAAGTRTEAFLVMGNKRCR